MMHIAFWLHDCVKTLFLYMKLYIFAQETTHVAFLLHDWVKNFISIYGPWFVCLEPWGFGIIVYAMILFGTVILAVLMAVAR